MEGSHWFRKLDSSEVEKEDFRIGLIQELSNVIEDLVLFCISGWPLAELVLSSGWFLSEWRNSYCPWPRLCSHLLQQPGENSQAHLEKQRKWFPRSPSTSPLIPDQSEIDRAPILHSVNPLSQDKCGLDWFRSWWQVGWDYLDCLIGVHTWSWRRGLILFTHHSYYLAGDWLLDFELITTVGPRLTHFFISSVQHRLGT